MNEEPRDPLFDHDEWADDPGFDKLDILAVVLTAGFALAAVIGIMVGIAYLIDGAVQWALA